MSQVILSNTFIKVVVFDYLSRIVNDRREVNLECNTQDCKNIVSEDNLHIAYLDGFECLGSQIIFPNT